MLQSFEILLMFSILLKSQVHSRLATRETTRIYHFVTNNHNSFDLWNLLNHQNVSNYYEYDCLKNFLLLLMSLLTQSYFDCNFIFSF